ncbi:MAG: hypothetical protein AAGA56_26950 [Myxococcota bacterium]
MERGDAALAGKELEAALRAYKQADAIMAVPSTRYAVGRTLARAGRNVEAYLILQSVAAIPQRESEPAAFVEARDLAAADADALAKTLAFAIVVPPVSGPNYTLSIDGRPWPGPEPAVVLPNRTYRLRVTTATGEAYATQWAARAGQRFRFVLEPARRVEAQPSTTDGSSEMPVPRGSSGLFGAPPPVAAWIAYGIGGAGLIAGAGLGIASMQVKSDVDERCPGGVCPDQAAVDDRDRGLALAHGATGSFVVAGAGAVAGTLLWALLPGPTDSADGDALDEARRSTSIRLQVGPLYGGVAGEF